MNELVVERGDRLILRRRPSLFMLVAGVLYGVSAAVLALIGLVTGSFEGTALFAALAGFLLGRSKSGAG